MRKIVYYVATSLDGFICGPGNDIGGFVPEGSGVAKYFADLAEYQTVIMGRNTYEFGYRFGLKPGEKAYQHMAHYIFSNSLKFDGHAPGVHIVPVLGKHVERIKEESPSDIYLCGGGQFAGWLFDNGFIDTLKVKLNPLILGAGIRIFGESRKRVNIELRDTQRYDHGLQIMTYDLK
ncbi:MAG TPA: dihydrofolate reductase family protein [Chryseosolibacter sp.]|nr:dihydrofolate reductase family protein [Chryseosolibacter sp.]